MAVDHEAINRVVKATYGKGVVPNPYAKECKEWQRCIEHTWVLEKIQAKIVSLYEPRFVTPPATAEAIAALVTLTDSRSVLEIGSLTSFTTLHILKALYGKSGVRIVAIDKDPAHDEDFFKDFLPILTHIKDSTPECLAGLTGSFDLVFVDSDHSLDHTKKEVDALMGITHPGSIFLFHDVPAWQTPDNPSPHPTREYLLNEPRLRGCCLASGEQADCLATFGAGYDSRLNPGLGVFVRL